MNEGSNMLNKIVCVLFLLLSIFTGVLFLVNTSGADSLTGYQIMKQVYKREKGDDASAEITFTTTFPKGNEKIRNTKRLWIDMCGQDGFSEKTLFFFLSPPEIKDTAFLTWNYEKSDKDDNQWVYLPALRKVRRIASSSKSDSFSGTEFSYADLNTRVPDEDTHVLLRNETLSDRNCYVVESIPKDRKDAYGRMVYWIDTDNLTVLKINYFDRKGRHLKTQKLRWELIQDIWTQTELTMENHLNGNKTIVVIDDVRYNTGLKENLFHERSLKRGLR